MSRSFQLAALCLIPFLASCSKDQEAPAAEPSNVTATRTTIGAPTTPAVPDGPAIAEADVSAILEEMTQALRKFSFEKKRLPTSIDELVTAGYLGAKPTAPGSKRFAIDPKEARVVLK